MTNFKLTMLQFGASRFLINNYQNNSDCIIIAVCGAGKTEMCFPLFNSIYKHSKIAFAIPRIDICTQIFFRLSQHYTQSQVGLHTGKKQINLNANLLVLTTNQLLKYHSYFDLIIIDEVDAFPFDVDPDFYLGVLNCKSPLATICYLTSTPSQRLLALNLPTYTIFKRWHNQPLPVPKLIQLTTDYKLNRTLINFFYNRNRQLLIFVSTITNGYIFSEILTKQSITHHFIYSTHPKRSQILEQFQNKQITVLLTTTILERGVTFDDIDVLIIDSDNSFYNKAALVQIAGRVGRKIEFQQGQVYFCYRYYTETIKSAVKFIKANNHKI